MKHLILSMTILLFEKNGTTTTKEVKDALHQFYGPGFDLTQAQTSQIMEQIFMEMPSTIGRDNRNSTQYFTYYPIVPVGNHTITFVNDDEDEDEDDDVVTSTTAVGVGGSLLNTNNRDGLSAKLLDSANGSLVAYVSGMPEKYVQGDDWKTIRKACFQANENARVGGLIYDDIRKISVAGFNKKYAASI